MIWLIGIWHAFQLEGYRVPYWKVEAETYSIKGPEVSKPFYDFLSQEALRIAPELLAEEMSEEGIGVHAKHGAIGSVALRVAREQKRQHLFMDPHLKERQVARITSDDQRERYWLRELMKTTFTSCICIVGHAHIRTFPALLQSEGIDHSILVDNFLARQGA